MKPPQPALSTRSATRLSGRFVRSTPGSQSLERGLQLLRVFRLGVAVLTNAQLAHRTGLPRPTVSRLTRSLVDAGFLAYDAQQGGYRLTVVCMSLALTFRSEQPALDLALPLMRSVAEGQRINVGMAVAESGEMVYLDSVRLSRLGVFRRIVAGTRIPMELTSLGRAHLAALSDADRKATMARLAQAHEPATWKPIAAQIRKAISDVHKLGCCHAIWHPTMVAIAAPITPPGGSTQVINISFPHVEAELGSNLQTYSAMLLDLVGKVQAVWAREL